MRSDSYYDREGNAISSWKHLSELLADADYRRVAGTAIGDVWISTVWLGLDHSFAFGSPPLIFETMIFPECHYCERTSTEAEARVAHDEAVADVESGAYAARCRAVGGGADATREYDTVRPGADGCYDIEESERAQLHVEGGDY